VDTCTHSTDTLEKIDAYWRAANYRSVGPIHRLDNPLLKRPLTLADIKPMLLATRIRSFPLMPGIRPTISFRRGFAVTDGAYDRARQRRIR
jgi:phosphoketolase